jgi:DNA ligase-1
MQQAAALKLNQKNWSQLYAIASTGKTKTWQTWVVEDLHNKTTIIWTKHGYIDGKLTETPKVIEKGKNIGRSNETTPFEQACSQAQSTFNKKIDKGYVENIDKINDQPKILLPMLAHSFKKRKHNIIYPAICQPKLNGVRCLATKKSDTEIDYRSRKSKSYNDTLGHLSKWLLDMLDIGETWDGEIYIHGWNFQQIVRRVKKMRADTHKLEYWVYDTINIEKIFATRHINYNDCIIIHGNHDNKCPIIAVGVTEAFNEKDVYREHNDYVRDGYEGVIIRNMDGLYKTGHRSADLQKYKEFEEAEFEIIGADHEVVQMPFDKEHREVKCVIFTCVNEDGKKFNVRPKGTVQQREKWFNDIETIKGKQLTVRFQERSEDNIPIFPVGIIIRDYE